MAFDATPIGDQSDLLDTLSTDLNRRIRLRMAIAVGRGIVE